MLAQDLENTFGRLKADNLRAMEKYAMMHYDFTVGKNFDPMDDIPSDAMANFVCKIAKEFHECEEKDLYNMFPLFFALKDTEYDDEIWRLYIGYQRKNGPSKNKRTIISVIAIQSLIDTPLIMFKKEFGAVDDDVLWKDVKIKEKDFATCFTSHLVTFGQWLNNPVLFMKYDFTSDKTAIFSRRHDSTQPLPITFDVSTFTMLGLYDKNPLVKQIGGFEGLNVKIVGKRMVFPHYIRNGSLREQVLERQKEQGLTDEQVADYERINFIVGAVTTNMSIPNNKLKKFMEVVKRIFKNTRDITEKEKVNYDQNVKLTGALPEMMHAKV